MTVREAILRGWLLIALGIFAAGFPASIPAGGSAAGRRYDLRLGDHLVFRERLERDVETGAAQSRTLVEWTAHVLVVGGAADRIAVGIQRNRVAAELARYVENGRDRLERERPRFLERLKRRARAFTEANWLDPAGSARLPVSALREWNSTLLLGIREIQPVPAEGAESAWIDPGPLALRMRTTPCRGSDAPSHVCFDAASAIAKLQVRFSRELGLASRLEFDAAYLSPPASDVHERVTFDLLERRRDERVDDWLASTDTQQGALAALIISGDTPVATARLSEFLASGDADLQRQALTLWVRRDLPPPPVSALKSLIGSQDVRVRTLAVHLAGRLPANDARPMMEKAAEDADMFTREAAAGWIRDHAAPPPARLAVPAQGRSCRDVSDRWARDRRLPPEPPGTTLRAMATGAFAGWPYVLRVPEDYTGDRPVPLVVYLTGGPGLAPQGAITVGPAFATTGYLVVYPHSDGLWWDEAPRQRTLALLDEVIRTFNVDTRRLYLAGFSNGGTGALYYATLWPHRFAAVAPSMAAMLGTGVPEGAFPASLGPMPVLLVHGTEDTVVPYTETTRNRERMARESPATPVTVARLTGRDHDVWPGSDEGHTLRFLEGRVRQSFPRAVTFEAPDLTSARRYWIEVLEKSSGIARVAARIGDDNTIQITSRRARRIRLLMRRELLPAAGPFRVRVNGREVFSGVLEEDCALFARTAAELGDPDLAYSAPLVFDVEGSGR